MAPVENPHPFHPTICDRLSSLPIAVALALSIVLGTVSTLIFGGVL